MPGSRPAVSDAGALEIVIVLSLNQLQGELPAALGVHGEEFVSNFAFLRSCEWLQELRAKGKWFRIREGMESSVRTVLTWLTTFFGNDPPRLSAEDVAKIRKDIAALRDEARVSNQAADQALAEAIRQHSRRA